jgi:hypothetical protein
MIYSDYVITHCPVTMKDIQPVLDFLTTELITCSANKILIVFTYTSKSYLDYISVSYDRFIRDFGEYLDYVVKDIGLPVKNIFEEISKKDWVNTCTAEVVKEYMDTLQLNNPSKKINYVALPYYFKPRFPPYQCIMNINKDIFPVYCNVGPTYYEPNEYKHIYMYAKNLDKLLSYDFTNVRNEVLIVFIFHAYYDTFWELDNPETLGNYDNFRTHFGEYLGARLGSRLEDRVLSNFFEEVNKAWYTQPTQDVTFTQCSRDSINFPVRYGRRLIDEYIDRLKLLYPTKTFNYIVIPDMSEPPEYIIL